MSERNRPLAASTHALLSSGIVKTCYTVHKARDSTSDILHS